jgi:hypothetical protein
MMIVISGTLLLLKMNIHEDSCDIHLVLEFFGSLIRVWVEREKKSCYDDV